MNTQSVPVSNVFFGSESFPHHLSSSTVAAITETTPSSIPTIVSAVALTAEAPAPVVSASSNYGASSSHPTLTVVIYAVGVLTSRFPAQ